jgi:anti-anti-sigma factor
VLKLKEFNQKQMLESILKININKENPDYTVIDFQGNLDSFGLSERRKELVFAVDECEKKYLVFNFSELDYINSESIGMLLQFNEQMMKKNQKLVLVSAKKNVIDVLTVIGLLETVPYYQSLDEFLSSGKKDAN